MITGRDLILYILEHKLEDEPIFEGGVFLGFWDQNEAAIKFDVGVATIKAWYQVGMLPGIEINGIIYVPANIERPNPSKLKDSNK